ncbi:phenylacetate--CoA ligase family protein [Thermodesulfobacteriota bacterium]
MITHFKSYIPGLAWPAYPNPLGAQMLSLLYQFEKSQYLPPEELLKNQFSQINGIFRHSIITVPFYKKGLKGAGFRKQRGITPEQWQEVPILSRSMVQQNKQDLLSRKIPKEHGKTHIIKTSGSTGLPIEVTGTSVTQFFYRAFALRDHFWHQRDFSGKMAALRFAPKGKAEYPGASTTDWGITTAGIINSGPGVMLNISTDITLQAEFLMREEPDYLLSYPSNLQTLAIYFLQNGLKLEKLKGVRTFGETLDSGVRSACNEAWGVPLVDMYTAQELGYIALQCPENEDRYHIQAENLFVEVVDEQGQPCKTGEVGRVLLTTLHNFAMPLIRYEIGDYAKVGGLCSCGRTLPVLSQIMGRQRNMLVFPDGRKTWPANGLVTGREDLPFRQFQLVQKSLDRIEARLVTERQFTPEEEKRLTIILQEALRHPFTIDVIYLENIPRSKGGKFEDFISEVA